jgi:L-malate glycosyltransferase
MTPQRRLKVAVVAASLRILGGQAIQAQRNLSGFTGDEAIEAWLVPINPIPPAPLDKLLAVKLLRTLVTQACYWPLLVRELSRADVVHIFSASYLSFLLSPLPAIVVAHLLRKPVLLNYHSGEAPDHLRRSAFARFVLKRLVDLNVVPSPFLRDVFAAHGIPAIVIANSINCQEFAYRPRSPMAPRLLSTRSFEPLYNVDCTLRAFALVQVRHPDASLTLVGGGSQDAWLRRRVQELGLTNVEFAGRVAPSAMASRYDEADIYVQTPMIDNMPLSVLEAFASGVPVVSTRVGGVPTMLTDGVHGYLAADNDAEQVAAQIESILADPDEARRRAAAARATCDAFEWPVVRTKWVQAYRSLAAASAVPATASDAARLPVLERAEVSTRRVEGRHAPSGGQV